MSGDRRRPRWKRGERRCFAHERCGQCGGRQLQRVKVEGKELIICERCSGFVPVEVLVKDEERGERRIYAGPGLQLLEVPSSALEFTARLVGFER